MESEIIQPLDETTRHLARTFDCCNDALNNFLKDPSRLYDESFKTWVYLTRDRETIIGYFAISAGSLDQMEEGKREKIGGSIHLDCFAIDKRFQNRRADGNILFCDILFAELLRLCREVQNLYIGVTFITLEATPEGKRLYARFDFSELEEDLIFSPHAGDSFSGCKMYFVLDEV